jgi:hypothetical protein
LAVIAVNCFAGLLGQLGQVDLNLPVTLAFLGAAISGLLGGLALANRFDAQSLRRAFAWSIIAVGAVLLFKNTFSGRTADPTWGPVSRVGRRLGQLEHYSLPPSIKVCHGPRRTLAIACVAVPLRVLPPM